MSCDSRKWECGYCTYLNFPSAIKCTMCRSQKPLQVIEEGAPPVNSYFSTDREYDTGPISHSTYRQLLSGSVGNNECTSSTQEKCVYNTPLSETISREPKKNDDGVISNINNVDVRECTVVSTAEPSIPESISSLPVDKSKKYWTCTQCSAKNWLNSPSCRNCNRSRSCQAVENKGDKRVTEVPKISELLDYKDYRDPKTPASSPVKSKHGSPKGAEKLISRSNSPSNANVNQDKWTCPVCTYSNWPRSVKCIMCMFPKSYDQPVEYLNEEVQNVNHSSVYPQANMCLDSVMTPSLANLSLGVSNNRGPNFSSANYDENTVNSTFTEALRRRIIRETEIDRRWLNACCGAVDGNIQAVEEYLTSGGDPTRQLSEAEVIFLNRPSAFDIGHTLIHLALRFHQEDVLATLLAQVHGEQPVVKRVPSYAAPHLASEIRRQVMNSIRPRKGSFRCHFSTEIVTFTLPSEIDDMSPETQETVFDEILDRDVQKELENGQIINWSLEISEQLSSRLYALWNRSAGDCLLDSVLQATWGIFDTENGLRRALSDSLHDCASQFYCRWRESELYHARLLNFSLNEAQCTTDWAKLLSLASQPGSSLEQLHIFALAHILRRPIIVYGVKFVKSFRGEAIGLARYEGIYIPFLWEPSFCWNWPITLGYTRGHFSALVPMEPDCDPLARVETAAQIPTEDINERSIYLPLTTVDGAMLPIHFLTQSEIGKEEFILSQWLDVAFTENGVMVARQRIQKRPLLVSQMVEEWLIHYRRLGQMTTAPFIRQPPGACYSSDGESDND